MRRSCRPDSASTVAHDAEAFEGPLAGLARRRCRTWPTAVGAGRGAATCRTCRRRSCWRCSAWPTRRPSTPSRSPTATARGRSRASCAPRPRAARSPRAPARRRASVPRPARRVPRRRDRRGDLDRARPVPGDAPRRGHPRPTSKATLVRRPLVAALALVVLAAVACDAATTSSVPDPLPTHASGGGGGGGGASASSLAVGDIACAPGDAVDGHDVPPRAAPPRCSPIRPCGGDALLGVVLLGDTQYERGRDAEYASFDATWGECDRPGAVADAPRHGQPRVRGPGPGARRAAAWSTVRSTRAGSSGTSARRRSPGPSPTDTASYARLFGRGTRHPLVVIVLDVGRCEFVPDACAAGGPGRVVPHRGARRPGREPALGVHGARLAPGALVRVRPRRPAVDRPGLAGDVRARRRHARTWS